MEFYEEKLASMGQRQGSQQAIIKVVGLGGGGGNAVNHMATQSYQGVEFICANTDSQALDRMNVDKVIRMGAKSTTKGLGAGMCVETGEAAAIEDKESIKEAITGADMLFIAAGMGGGTGTGSAPVVARIVKEENILTVAVVTKPFGFEGTKKSGIADEGIKQLINQVDSLIVLPNDKLVEKLDDEVLDDMKQVFACSDDVLANAVSSITELITQVGHMNLDFADVKTVMSAPGKAMMGSGCASGEGRADKAVKLALSNPLIEGVNLNNAQGILVNISAAKIGMKELQTIGDSIDEYASKTADIKIGTSNHNGLMRDDEIKVTIIATGLSAHRVISEEMFSESYSLNAENEVVNGQSENSDNFAFNAADEFIQIQSPPPQDLTHARSDLTIPAYIRKQLA